MTKPVPPEQLSLLFQGHLGLIVGPDLTLGQGAADSVSVRVASSFSVAKGFTYLDTCDAAQTAGHTQREVQHAIAEFVAAQAPSPYSKRLAEVRWGAVLSYALDSHFEDGIRAATTKNAFRPPCVVIPTPGVPIPPRCIPVFKILGSAGRDTLVASKYDYSRDRPRWRHAVRAFLDLVKGAPVLCLGMSGIPWALADILAELGSLPTFPTSLVVLEEDALVQTSVLDRMVDPRTSIVLASGTAGDLVRVAEAGMMIPNPIVPRSPRTSPYDALHSYDDLALVVNAQLTPTLKKEERQQLLEVLFAPTTVHWDPFAHGLDFGRSLAHDIEDELSEQPIGGVTIVEGAAATGKTVLLKRVAFDLAKKGHLVLWLRPYFYPDAMSRLDQLFKALSKVAQQDICIVQDDPYGIGTLSIKQVALSARSNDVSARFLIGVRSSDWHTREPADLLGSLKLHHTAHLPDALDDEEWARLAGYLQSLGIARSITDAQQQLTNAASRSARDTLSMLYWLVPQTRAHINDSIKEEYFRLGDHAGFTRIVLGHAHHSSDLVKRAYEFVAVADKYRASIPVEVLVTALQVDYSSWLEATNAATGAWGLIYAEDNEAAETFIYRTRNDVVTKLLVDALNGGSLSRSGELRILRNTLDACTGSHPSYREYCERLLVGNDELLRLEYADGLDLYDRALGALPHQNKSILHHKGIWMRRKGRRPLDALEVFDAALRAPPTPYAKRSEADEHIYTSIAAAAIDAIKEGVLSVDAGKERALAAIARARSSSFFNASAVHVHANLAFELAERLGMESADSKHLTASALADVDRTVLVLEANPTRDAGEEVGMLREVRDRIVQRGLDLDEARAQAEVLWATQHNQDGFCLAARALLHLARAQQKGTAYKRAFEYCSECVTKVTDAGLNPLAALYEVRVHILYEWRIRAWRERPNGSFIDWELFRNDVAHVLPAVSSPLYRYFEAVALSHLGNWNDASGAFAQVRQAKAPRDVLWSRRDMLLDSRGNPRELQGTIRRANDRLFIHVEEVGSDFMCDRDCRWPEPGEIAVCYVELAFGGWTAVRRPG